MSSRVVVVRGDIRVVVLAATLKQWAHLGVGGGEVGDQSVPVTWLLAIADDAISLASRCAEVIRDTRLKLTGGRYNGIWAWWDIQVIHQAMDDELGEEECRLLLRKQRLGGLLIRLSKLVRMVEGGYERLQE